MSLRIEDYALIGDGRSAALVGRDGSIDWLCWPRFDGDACFAALLGGRSNGRWQVAPAEPAVSSRRRYWPGTAILESTFETAHDTLVVTDLMPWTTAAGAVVRRIACARGRVAVRSELLARFDHGRARPWCRSRRERWQLVMGPVALWTDGARMRRDASAEAIVGEWTLEAGQQVDLALQCLPAWQDDAPALDVDAAIDATAAFWRRWSERHAARGPHAGQALRSLITLKALTDRSTGGVVAAPTSSLPERLGGRRNWDYRYSWLRDASFTLLAFAASGFGDEAARWRDWLLRSIGGHPEQLQIMYAVDGRRRVDEWECDWLDGYEGARPVRFGNAAAGQLQIDVLGEVINALYQSRRRGLPPDREVWTLECRLVEHLSRVWRDPGHGIWEMRGEPRVFTLSRAMAWVGVDRALRSAKEFGLPAPVAAWSDLAHAIRDDVLTHGYDRRRGRFTQVYGAPAVDASLLLLPLYGFLPADDDRVVATVQAIEQELGDDGLLRRYRDGAEDGMDGGEGCFLACSFWLAHVRVLQGRIREARELLDRTLACGNDVACCPKSTTRPRAGSAGIFPRCCPTSPWSTR